MSLSNQSNNNETICSSNDVLLSNNDSLSSDFSTNIGSLLQVVRYDNTTILISFSNMSDSYGVNISNQLQFYVNQPLMNHKLNSEQCNSSVGSTNDHVRGGASTNSDNSIIITPSELLWPMR